jgi:hypothetical protein
MAAIGDGGDDDGSDDDGRRFKLEAAASRLRRRGRGC